MPMIGTLSSGVPVIPEHAPLSAPTFSAAPLEFNFFFSELLEALGFCLTAVLLQIVIHHGLPLLPVGGCKSEVLPVCRV